MASATKRRFDSAQRTCHSERIPPLSGGRGSGRETRDPNLSSGSAPDPASDPAAVAAVAAADPFLAIYLLAAAFALAAVLPQLAGALVFE